MGFSSKKKLEIQATIIELISKGLSPYTYTLQTYKISRQTINTYLKQLETGGIIESTGNTTRKIYKLKTTNKFIKKYSFRDNPNITEEDIYSEFIQPTIENLKTNIIDITHYAVTEMINNVIDHSGSDEVSIYFWEDFKCINICIEDYGVGIFRKIMTDHNLTNEDEAIFQLHKGKLTSDEERHSGEGIFFTSRACDFFAICSRGKSFLSKDNKDFLDSLTKASDVETLGTQVYITLNKFSTKNLAEVFSNFTDNNYGFSKTEVRIKLAEQFSSTLMSRSQAKRVLSGFNKFKEIILDFNNIRMIGQGFADEIFRVFRKTHPDINITPINANKDVQVILDHVINQL